MIFSITYGAKKIGEFRACRDFRALNALTIQDHNPLPNVQDCTDLVSGCTVFSSIDIVKAYHQISVESTDLPKTVITSSFCLFVYVRMPFRLRNTAQTFQRFIDQVVRGLLCCFAYLDYLLVPCVDTEQHTTHLLQFLARLREYGVLPNTGTCDFEVPELEFLSYLSPVQQGNCATACQDSVDYRCSSSNIQTSASPIPRSR